MNADRPPERVRMQCVRTPAHRTQRGGAQGKRGRCRRGSGAESAALGEAGQEESLDS